MRKWRLGEPMFPVISYASLLHGRVEVLMFHFLLALFIIFLVRKQYTWFR